MYSQRTSTLVQQFNLNKIFASWPSHLFIYTLTVHTNNCNSSHQPIKLLKIVDDTILIRLISDGDKATSRLEMGNLVSWSSQNNLVLNALKTAEMVVNFRNDQAPPSPITMHHSSVDIVEFFRFLGFTVTQDCKWKPNISRQFFNVSLSPSSPYLQPHCGVVLIEIKGVRPRALHKREPSQAMDLACDDVPMEAFILVISVILHETHNYECQKL